MFSPPKNKKPCFLGFGVGEGVASALAGVAGATVGEAEGAGTGVLTGMAFMTGLELECLTAAG